MRLTVHVNVAGLFLLALVLPAALPGQRPASPGVAAEPDGRASAAGTVGRAGSPLVGTWEFVTYRDTPEGAAPLNPYGEHPIGLMIFTADGRFSMSLMRNPPDIGKASVDPDPEACVPEWYCSYFGTYQAKPGAGTWVTQVTGGNIPAYLGTAQTRRYEIRSGNLLIGETYTDEHGRRVNAERVLRRVGR